MSNIYIRGFFKQTNESRDNIKNRYYFLENIKIKIGIDI